MLGTGRGGMFSHPYRNKPFPFDIVLAAEAFPVVQPNDSDEKLTAAVLEAAKNLEPTEKERAELAEFVAKVHEALEKIRTTTDADYLPGVVLEGAHDVGSFKKNTMLRGDRCADVVVVLKSMPTIESIGSIGEKLCKELSDANGVVSMVSRPFGFILTKKEDKVRILISTVQSNTAGLEKDLHLPYQTIAANQAAIYHARCFDDFGKSDVCPLVRVFKSLRRRFPGLEPINIWAFESLIQYCLITTPSGGNLPAGPCFKRVLAQLAAGIFLPGSSGLSDPVDHRYRLCDTLTFAEMDGACSTAQTLLRIVGFGGWSQLFDSADLTPSDLAGKLVYVGDIAIAPLAKAYEPDAEEAKNVKMETEVKAESK